METESFPTESSEIEFLSPAEIPKPKDPCRRSRAIRGFSDFLLGLFGSPNLQRDDQGNFILRPV
ncbi:MAG: hypothetical protein A2Y67_03485 [Candidatus Buchananbacteria bacterium RBG_13_39_9]|uniref:Uncharacterized protein n=1 Tax=Candidatus Buchananbacteria bacterium RBG_13_39_9 TaxID=1797531 RepID=A0A1G1XTG3_9BACT|nr:MAG: hypothetical protein A2Y67_03485 [Candidatus Buchananbacteria bacterium RBG_13_39_9]